MRLLKRVDYDKFSLTEFFGNDIPCYAILSHTWGRDSDEVSFEDITNDAGSDKAGYKKLQFCADQAAKDGLMYFWVDTCCIKKSSDPELSEAIRSMFKWYQEASRCYVYLSDILVWAARPPGYLSPADLGKSKWFTRGWTLQELLAPSKLQFFSAERVLLGDKRSRMDEIHAATGIATGALQGTPLSHFSISDRFVWAKDRSTKRGEDAAYSLQGIFDVHIPLMYGEGRKNAMKRIRKEIQDSLGYNAQPTFADSAHQTSSTQANTTIMKGSKMENRKADRTIIAHLAAMNNSQQNEVMEKIFKYFRGACYKFYNQNSLSRTKYSAEDGPDAPKLFASRGSLTERHRQPRSGEDLSIMQWFTKIRLAWNRSQDGDVMLQGAVRDADAFHQCLMKADEILSLRLPNGGLNTTFCEQALENAIIFSDLMRSWDSKIHLQQFLQQLKGPPPKKELHKVHPFAESHKERGFDIDPVVLMKFLQESSEKNYPYAMPLLNSASFGASEPPMMSGSSRFASPKVPESPKFSVHDDPYTERLVSLGYARSTVVRTLEKYDYDLDKASEALAAFKAREVSAAK